MIRDHSHFELSPVQISEILDCFSFRSQIAQLLKSLERLGYISGTVKVVLTAILGFSYGTTLGATVAAMFPDRIDKMILDGVQNPHQYYHAHA